MFELTGAIVRGPHTSMRTVRVGAFVCSIPIVKRFVSLLETNCSLEKITLYNPETQDAVEYYGRRTEMDLYLRLNRLGRGNSWEGACQGNIGCAISLKYLST